MKRKASDIMDPNQPLDEGHIKTRRGHYAQLHDRDGGTSSELAPSSGNGELELNAPAAGPVLAEVQRREPSDSSEYDQTNKDTGTSTMENSTTNPDCDPAAPTQTKAQIDDSDDDDDDDGDNDDDDDGDNDDDDTDDDDGNEDKDENQGSKRTYMYMIMKRSSEYDSDPIRQFCNIDCGRYMYTFNEGMNYSRPHGRVFAVFHDDNPAQALKLFRAEVDKVENELAQRKGWCLPNLFVETDPEEDVEKTGFIRAVLAHRRKARPRSEACKGVELSQEERDKNTKKQVTQERMTNRDPEDDGPSDEDEDDGKYLYRWDGEKSIGMVFMWIERWYGADMVSGARNGKMLMRKEVRPVGLVYPHAKSGSQNEGREYTDEGWAW